MTIRRIGGWIGAGLADAAGRLVILSVTTAFLARILPPGDFGATALTLSIVTAFSMAVGTPYEEALTQAKVVRRDDLGAVLALSMVAALGFLALCVPVGFLLDHVYERADLRLLLPTTGLLLLAQGPMTLATAVARRRKAFYIINASSILGHVIGAVIAIGLGLAGAGIWSLVALRIVLVFASAASLFWMLGLKVRPVWSWGRLARFNRFAGSCWPRASSRTPPTSSTTPSRRALRPDRARLSQHRHAADRTGARGHHGGDAQPVLPAFPGQCPLAGECRRGSGGSGPRDLRARRTDDDGTCRRQPPRRAAHGRAGLDHGRTHRGGPGGGRSPRFALAGGADRALRERSGRRACSCPTASRS